MDFEELWARYQKPISYYVGRLLGGSTAAAGQSVGGQDVEDVVQDIMIKVMKKAGRLEEKRGATTWVYRVARNHCIDLKRRGRLRGNVVPFDPEVSGNRAHDPARLAEEASDKKLVDSFLERQEEVDRTILFLRYFEDLGHGDIARVVGMPEGTVRYRVHQAKERLRVFMERANGQ